MSGHIPNEMTGAELVESGLDELQHLFYLRVGAAGIRGLGTDRNVGARMASVHAGTEVWEAFVRKLLDHDDVVVDTEEISDIRRVVTVVKGGTVYDPAAIYRALGIEPCCEE